MTFIDMISNFMIKFFIFTLFSFVVSCTAAQLQDTPEAFILRLKNATSEQDFVSFKHIIFAKESELNELAKDNLSLHFDWNNEKPTGNIEDQLTKMKALMVKIVDNEANDFYQNKRQTLQKMEFSEIKIDTSSEAIGQIFFMDIRPKNLSVAQISANINDPQSGQKGTIKLLVCRLKGGNWKVWSHISMTELD